MEADPLDKGRITNLRNKKSHGLDELAASAGFRWDNRDRRWHVRCQKCLNEFSGHWVRNMNPDAMIKKANARGWDTGFGSEPKCPEHKTHRPLRVVAGKNLKAALKDGAAQTSSFEEAAKASNIRGVEQRLSELNMQITFLNQQPSEEPEDQQPKEGISVEQATVQPNMKLGRQVIRMLEEHFGEETGLYEAGWSDDRIAKETGASAEFVVKTRCDAFRDLADPPEILKFREELVMLELEEEEIQTKLNEIIRKRQALSGQFEQWLQSTKLSGRPRLKAAG